MVTSFDGRPIKTISPEENIVQFKTKLGGVYMISARK
jgi:hypothetical protein